MRDEFKKSVIDRLAKRAHYLCAFPGCRRFTVAPSGMTDGVASVGVAAHITAASRNGPRYDPLLSPAERASIENAIWLCRDHATLIDADDPRFPVPTIRAWKRDHELWVQRQQDSRASVDAPVYSNLSIHRDEGELVGRRGLVKRIRAVLRTDPAGAILHGLSGQGKTALAEVLASEALRHVSFPGGVFWIRAGDRSDLQKELEEVAVALGYPREISGQRRVEAVRKYLAEVKVRTLLVLDGIPTDPGWLVDDLLQPRSGSVRILGTTQAVPHGPLMGPGKPKWIAVEGLSPSASKDLLRRRCERLSTDECGQLALLLQGHPMALASVSDLLSYHPEKDAREVIELLMATGGRRNRDNMLQREKVTLEALRTVVDTLPKDVRDVVDVCANLAPEPVPQEFLVAVVRSKGGFTEGEARDVLGILHRFHLARLYSPSDRLPGVLIHPLVRIVGRQGDNVAAVGQIKEGIVAWMGARPPSPEQSAAMYPHIRVLWAEMGLVAETALFALAKVRETNKNTDVRFAGGTAAPLFAARVLKHHGGMEDLRSAHLILSRLLPRLREVEASDGVEVVTFAIELAIVLGRIGTPEALAEGIRHLEETIAVVNDTDAAIVRSNLSVLLAHLDGGAAMATKRVELMRRALAAFEPLAADQPMTRVEMLGNLAVALRATETEENRAEADHLSETVLGIVRDHFPGTLLYATALHNWATGIVGRGDRARLPEIEAALRESLAIKEGTWGPRSVQTVETLLTLARVSAEYSRQNEVAVVLAKDAYEIAKAVLGAEHPRTIRARRWLAVWSGGAAIPS